MSSGRPCVSVGLPVFNGENYVSEAIDSLLAQTFGDFEIIISDNASTDRTEKICRGYAALDRRIRYYRLDRNRGAAWNFNRTFDLSRGRYFKWAAHDDVCAPDFLKACCEVLDREPEVVLAYPRIVDIGPDGRAVRSIPFGLPPDARPHERFRFFVCTEHACLATFGLIRSEILGKTGRIRSHPGSDRLLLAELCLWGRFHEVPRELFFHREHPARSDRALSTATMQAAWFDAGKSQRRAFHHFRQCAEYAGAAWRSPLPWRDRLVCGIQVRFWLRRRWKAVVRDALYSLVRSSPAYSLRLLPMRQRR